MAKLYSFVVNVAFTECEAVTAECVQQSIINCLVDFPLRAELAFIDFALELSGDDLSDPDITNSEAIEEFQETVRLRLERRLD